MINQYNSNVVKVSRVVIDTSLESVISEVAKARNEFEQMIAKLDQFTEYYEAYVNDKLIGFVRKDELDDILANYQKKVKGGNLIEVTDDGTINFTGRNDLYRVVDTLPTNPLSNVIYLVPFTDEQGNVRYKEWTYNPTTRTWEEMGVMPLIDLDKAVSKDELATELAKYDDRETADAKYQSTLVSEENIKALKFSNGEIHSLLGEGVVNLPSSGGGSDLPPIEQGDKGKSVVVNDNEDGYTLKKIDGGGSSLPRLGHEIAINGFEHIQKTLSIDWLYLEAYEYVRLNVNDEIRFGNYEFSWNDGNLIIESFSEYNEWCFVCDDLGKPYPYELIYEQYRTCKYYLNGVSYCYVCLNNKDFIVNGQDFKEKIYKAKNPKVIGYPIDDGGIPPYTTLDKKKALMVNSTGTALEWNKELPNYTTASHSMILSVNEQGTDIKWREEKIGMSNTQALITIDNLEFKDWNEDNIVYADEFWYTQYNITNETEHFTIENDSKNEWDLIFRKKNRHINFPTLYQCGDDSYLCVNYDVRDADTIVFHLSDELYWEILINFGMDERIDEGYQYKYKATRYILGKEMGEGGGSELPPYTTADKLKVLSINEQGTDIEWREETNLNVKSLMKDGTEYNINGDSESVINLNKLPNTFPQTDLREIGYSDIIESNEFVYAQYTSNLETEVYTFSESGNSIIVTSIDSNLGFPVIYEEYEEDGLYKYDKLDCTIEGDVATYTDKHSWGRWEMIVKFPILKEQVKGGSLGRKFCYIGKGVSESGSELPPIVGNANKILAVKEDETGIEWVEGGDGKINSISINGTELPIDTNKNVDLPIDKTLEKTGETDNTLPTSKAVIDYINSIDYNDTYQNGEYISSINQEDGKIAPLRKAFDQSIDSTASNNNAPTTKATYDYVNEELAKKADVTALQDYRLVSDSYSKTEVYNKTENDNLLNAKADLTYVTFELSKKADVEDVYDKTTTDEKLALKADVDYIIMRTISVNGEIITPASNKNVPLPMTNTITPSSSVTEIPSAKAVYDLVGYISEDLEEILGNE